MGMATCSPPGAPPMLPVLWMVWTGMNEQMNESLPMTFFLKLVPALIHIWLKSGPCIVSHICGLCVQRTGIVRVIGFVPHSMQKRPNWWHFSSQQLLKSGRILFLASSLRLMKRSIVLLQSFIFSFPQTAFLVSTCGLSHGDSFRHFPKC